MLKTNTQELEGTGIGVVSGVVSEIWRGPLLGPVGSAEAEYEMGRGHLGLASRMSRNGPWPEVRLTGLGTRNCEWVWGRAAGSTVRWPHLGKFCSGEEAMCQIVHLSDHLHPSMLTKRPELEGNDNVASSPSEEAVGTGPNNILR